VKRNRARRWLKCAASMGSASRTSDLRALRLDLAGGPDSRQGMMFSCRIRKRSLV
jgi:hypothetical protein